MASSTRIIVIWLVLTEPLSAVGQSATAAAATTAANQLAVGSEDTSPLRQSRWHLELTGSFLRESWDVNRVREQLVGATVVVGREIAPHWILGATTSLFHVAQEPLPGAFLPTWSVLLRRSLYKVGVTSVFADGGSGLSYASAPVPNQGTRFNFVSHLGIGVQRRLTQRVGLIARIRWLHLSNNGLNGRASNPDIQALGIDVGWQVH